MDVRREHAIGVAFLFLTAACWGFVAISVKRLTAEVDPYTISFARVSLASLVFVVLFVAQKGDWSRIRWFLPWILLGALGRTGNYLMYNAGLVHLPANATNILAPAQTVGVILLARWILKERIRGKWVGILISLVGVGLIWWNGKGWQTLLDLRHAGGNTLLVLAGLSTSLQFTSQKVLASAKMTSLESLIPVFGWSSLLTLPVAAVWGGPTRPYSAFAWVLMAFLGLVLTGGSFLFMAEGYRRCTATTAVIITNTTTFFTLVWSRLLLGESASPAMIVGTVLGVAGSLAVIQADRRVLRESAVQGAD